MNLDSIFRANISHFGLSVTAVPVGTWHIAEPQKLVVGAAFTLTALSSLSRAFFAR